MSYVMPASLRQRSRRPSAAPWRSQTKTTARGSASPTLSIPSPPPLDALVPRGGRLPARFVIHAVGPVYRDGRQGEPELLASAYRRSLEVAVEHGLRSVAFPSISTGAYRFPIAEAAPIGLGTVVRFLVARPGTLTLVRFVLFGDADLAAYETVLAALRA